MFDKIISLPKTNPSLYMILTEIRESLYDSIISNTKQHTLSQIDAYLDENNIGHLSYKARLRIEKIENTSGYLDLKEIHSAKLVKAMLYIIICLELIINKLLLKNSPYQVKRLDNDGYNIHLSKKTILGIIKNLLETKIENSFYHSKPITIFQLEKDQLIRRMNQDKITKEITETINTKNISTEMCSYLLVNILIKYFMGV